MEVKKEDFMDGLEITCHINHVYKDDVRLTKLNNVGYISDATNNKIITKIEDNVSNIETKKYSFVELLLGLVSEVNTKFHELKNNKLKLGIQKKQKTC